MAGSVEVGSGVLTLIASAKGIGKNIVSEIAPDMVQAGKDAGKTLSKGITSSAEQGLRQSADQLASAVVASQSRVEAASKSLTLQRNKEADAAGKLRVEETKLQALKDSGKATDAQMVAQSEKVIKAQRDLAVQSSQTKAAIKDLTAATGDAAQANKKLGDGGDESSAKLKSAEGGTKGLSKGMGLLSMAAGAALAAVTAAVAGISAAIQSAIDKQAGQAKLTAQLGLDPAEAKRLGGIAGKTYAGAYGESLDEVNTAIRRVTQDIGKGSDEWTQKTTENVLSVANAFEEDLGGVTRAVGNLIRNGLAKDATEGLDIVTRGLQNGANKADDLLDTFNEYSTMFRDLGLDGKKSLGLISQGLLAGARDADTVADGLKEFAIRAQDASTTSARGFEAIGLNAKEMTRVFAKGGPEAAAALDTVLDRLRNMEDPVKRNTTAVDLFGTKAEDLGDALFALDPSQAVATLGQVDGAAQKVNDTLSDTISSKVEGWKRTIQKNVVDYLTNTVLPFFRDLANQVDIQKILAGIQEVTAKVRDVVGGVISDIRNWAATHQAEIQNFLNNARDAFNSAKAWMLEMIGVVQFLWENFGGPLMDFAITRVSGFLQFLQGAFEFLRGLFLLTKGFLTGDWTTMWEGIKEIGKGIWNIIIGLVDAFIGSVVELLGGDWEKIKSDTKAAWDAVVAFVRSHVTDVLNIVQDIAAIPGKVAGWFGQMKDGAVAKLNELLDFVRSVPQRIKDGLGNPVDLLFSIGKNMFEGMINGMKAKVGELIQTAKDIAMAPVNAAKNILGIKSPSRVFAEIGRFVGAGFVIGMNSTTGAVNLAGNNLAIAAIPNLGQIAPGSSSQSTLTPGGAAPVTINVYGAEGQSVDSLAEAVANKQRILGRI